ncbi:MAG: oligosaccharide flippase family protein [Acidobacteriia bacterium]|nr:oligosaccharide flippase family protein [Terriglobia bacterium]
MAPQPARLSSTVRGGLRLGGGQVVTQACSFIRNVILARLISVEDFGVAAAFAMTLSLLEMISNVSADKLLIQAADGDEPAFQNTAHFVHVLRGFGNGFVLFIAGSLAARLFGLPQAVWGFRSLALLPIIRGFIHLDSNRVQRDMRFGPAVTIDVVSNLVVTLLAYPLAAYLRNYTAMLWILMIQAATSIMTSHWVAERRYGWTWQRCYTRRMFTFGWPLLINGLLLYGIMQGDRVIIGSAKQLFPHTVYTLADLGAYSVAFSFTMAPTMFAANLASSLFLPPLARASSSPPQFAAQYMRRAHAICLVTALVTIPFIAAGGALVTTIYGDKYRGAVSVIGWLAIMWGVRTLRLVPTIANLAHADTAASLIANAVRSMAFIGMLYAAFSGAGLVWIAISAVLGELFAFPTLLFRLKRRHGVSSTPWLRQLALVGLGMALTQILVGAVPLVRSNSVAALAAALLMTSGTVSAMFLFIPQLRRDASAALAPILSRLRGTQHGR